MVYRRLPRRPPLRRVQSDGMGVTSSKSKDKNEKLVPGKGFSFAKTNHIDEGKYQYYEEYHGEGPKQVLLICGTVDRYLRQTYSMY